MSLPIHQLSAHAHDFIDDVRLESFLSLPEPEPEQVRAILARSLDRKSLDVEQTGVLLRARAPELRAEILEAARTLKQRVYGKRVVLFAPLYVGNHCVNDCAYCSFRRSNPLTRRRSLAPEELSAEVRALVEAGHKRLVLVFGEHPRYDAETIARTVESVYAFHSPKGEIRRLNLNAAPLNSEGFARVHKAGIGTYQIFQESYHHATYAAMHPANTPKGDFLYRLDGPGRAIDAGLDDVGIGALFGLYDWRFEVLGLVAHACFLQETHGVGPHTISMPRLKPSLGLESVLAERTRTWGVSDEDFKLLVAILRLAVPYTGLILTAREPPELRREILAFGVSQIDGGSRIEIGAYAEAGAPQRMEREQFLLGDTRSLDEILSELLEDGYLPSFCTACYRKGRTGEHFMELAQPGFIKRYCTPNALCTLEEYLRDFGTERSREVGRRLIDREIAAMEGGVSRDAVEKALEGIRERGERDPCF